MTEKKAGKANRLINESSPYLLQHAYNPVDWFPWGEEAFNKAREENKPVLVSIGYAACHWCHVMERESFENAEVAALMNTHFINIKVDREERPDIDHIYMDAVQAISGSGGWPLNVFVTADRRPFYGGTYFPPVKAFNRASWTEVLLSISQAYIERREDIEQQAGNLTEHLKSSNTFGVKTSATTVFKEEKLKEAYQHIMQTADKEWGGFGRAPKFPQTFTLNYLLTYSHIYKEEPALRQALVSLDKMIHGGIYDHIGGGFARYSTDAEWLVPHFEKMLYDNALLVATLADAFLLTGEEKYKERMGQTLEFVERELMDPSGGFYSALDADSEGEEGKYYVWSEEEVKNTVTERADLFCHYYDITSKGNWEGVNIPWIPVPLETVALQGDIDIDELKSIVEKGRKQLLAKRQKKPQPLLDDKVLLGWNALMNITYTKAYAATANVHYKEIAEKNMNFLLHELEIGNGGFYHAWKNGKAKQEAFLDDYACLIAALIELAQTTSNFNLLEKASELTQFVMKNFSDQETPFFCYTHRLQKDVLFRKKEVYDGAIPSGNALMAQNLYKLSIVLDQQIWKLRAENMINAMGEVIIKYPSSFGVWLSTLFEMIKGTNEIAVVGKKWKSYLEQISGLFIPHKLIMASEKTIKKFPLLADKAGDSEILIYLCRNYACHFPVNSIHELRRLL